MTATLVPPAQPGGDDLHARIAGDLLAYMGKHRISQRKLAAVLAVDQSTVSRWFNKDMNLTDVERVCRALGLDIRLVLANPEGQQLSLPKVRAKLGLIAGGGRTILTTSPMLTVSTTPVDV